VRRKPTIKACRTVARTRVFQIDELEIEFANGRIVRFEALESGGQPSVLIVPLLDDNTVLLVREYAAACDSYELGFPKGLVEPDEDLLEAANRELMEEAGYAARNLRELRPVTLAPGYIRHHTHVILARDLMPARLPGDEPEELETVPWPLDDTEQLLRRQDFSEARSIASLLMVRDLINYERNQRTTDPQP
jgi:ADP-ribose diphosphatase